MCHSPGGPACGEAIRVPATVVPAVGATAVVSGAAFFSDPTLQALNDEEATTKHTKDTKNRIFWGTALTTTSSLAKVCQPSKNAGDRGRVPRDETSCSSCASWSLPLRCSPQRRFKAAADWTGAPFP